MASPVLLGVDLGTVRVGLALATEGLVLPLEALAHPGDEGALLARLVAVARERGAEAFVVGLPLHMSGDESPMARRFSALAEALRAASGIPVHLQDERLTSHEAEAALRASGLRWHEVDKGHIDCVAAMAILRDYLEAQGGGGAGDAAGEEPPEPTLPDPGPSRRGRRRDLRGRRRRRD
ncbi:MAG: Holliday junction resolvase RuvX [Planctomycetota bacterium]